MVYDSRKEQAMRIDDGENVPKGHRSKHAAAVSGPRPHPQVSYDQTAIAPSSFFGKLQSIYGNSVLKTQLEQLKKQGSYDAFDLKWHEVYNVRRFHGARTLRESVPPSLFWESDVGKWIEAVSYFMSSGSIVDPQLAKTFERAVGELVEKIEKAQAEDGYLDIYFQVVDKEGKFRNLRDAHEMYNCGHLLEGALAHYHWTGSKRFLNCMIRYVDLLIRTFGPEPSQLHGYPGHPELELAVSRLYHVTGDPKHLAFATYLLEARGSKPADMDGESYFVWEAKHRRGGDTGVPQTMDKLTDLTYSQAHDTLHNQTEILGHSVRAFYLTTGAADVGGEFLKDAKRLLHDATTRKMYVTGGFGTEPRWEGFSRIPYRMPQSTAEGGCYQETCASIACMMTCERILSHEIDGATRDVMELCLLNAVLGGGSLDGTKFAYENKLATCGNETAERSDWFEVCCCPPNLSRTIGMLGGYTWSAIVDEASKTINLNVWLFVSATRRIPLGNGQEASVTMKTDMPWYGRTSWQFDAPEGWTWAVRIPRPSYAENVKTSATVEQEDGFSSFAFRADGQFEQIFDLPVRLLSSHPRSGQDLITVSRGPITYTAESIDNAGLDNSYHHFEGLGISDKEVFEESLVNILGVNVITLTTKGSAYVLSDFDRASLYEPVSDRLWSSLGQSITFVPWFARANRGGAGRVRTSFPRVPSSQLP
ncbi:hypothetical protein BD324DRAFT_632751 [Kockovaella imperatae]|uniref:DUF1680 domain protein n=1 Tax=Kockovaella imperatae TaxID=4999 RepID=A0A1Y1UD23_9TREE|nr:hypothetical protein BD324DRAFT_632751 [Kockovaella imperatae]ORX35416.1 hypothetical protein BD324DRAFT_632751 [Kockovaella imperatae]